MSLKLATVVFDYLKLHPEEKFTARQLAEWVLATYPAECGAKKAASSFITTDAQLVQQLTAEIGAQRPGPTVPRLRRSNMQSVGRTGCLRPKFASPG